MSHKSNFDIVASFQGIGDKLGYKLFSAPTFVLGYRKLILENISRDNVCGLKEVLEARMEHSELWNYEIQTTNGFMFENFFTFPAGNPSLNYVDLKDNRIAKVFESWLRMNQSPNFLPLDSRVYNSLTDRSFLAQDVMSPNLSSRRYSLFLLNVFGNNPNVMRSFYESIVNSDSERDLKLSSFLIGEKNIPNSFRGFSYIAPIIACDNNYKTLLMRNEDFFKPVKFLVKDV